LSVVVYPSGSHRAQSLPSTTPALALRIPSQDPAPISGIFADVPHRLELLRLLVDPPSDNIQRQPSVRVEASQQRLNNREEILVAPAAPVSDALTL
jgi:hypothetical protein